MDNKKKIAIACILVVAFLFLWILTHKLELSRMWAYGDLIAFPSTNNVFLDWSFFSWNQDGMGFISFKPFNYYLSAFVVSNFIGSTLAQKLFLFFPLPLSFFTFFLFSRKTNLKLAPAILGAFVYAINPITIAEIVSGSVTLIVYSVFPLIFLLLHRLLWLRKPGYVDAVLLGVTSFAVFNVHAAFWYLTLVLPLLFFAVFQAGFNIKQLGKLLIPLSMAAFILLPNLIGYVGIGSNTSVSTSYLSDASYCYSDSSIGNIIRLSGNRGSAQAAEYLGYNVLTLQTALGYVIFAIGLLAFMPLIRKTGREQKDNGRLFYPLAVGAVLIVGLILLVKAYPGLVDLNPVLSSLRNPVKLMYPFAFVLCFFFALGSEQLFKMIKSKFKPCFSVMIAIVLIVLISLYNLPALDGSLGLNKTRGNGYYIEDKYSELPSIFNQLNASNTDYRVLFLPWEYSELLKVSSQEANYFGIALGSGTTSKTDWLKQSFEIAVSQSSPDRSRLLGLYSVKFVVIDKTYDEPNTKTPAEPNIYSSYDSYWIAGNPQYFYKIFDADKNFNLKFEDNDFAVFENTQAINPLYSRATNLNITTDYLPNSENLIKSPSPKTDLQYWQVWPTDALNITEDNVFCVSGQKEWWANINQNVSVEENKQYLLSFAVKAVNITDLHAKIMWFNTTTSTSENEALSVEFVRLYE